MALQCTRAYSILYLGPETGTCIAVTQHGGTHSAVARGIIYIYVYYIYYSTAWRAGRWASRRAADRREFLRALHYGWAYMLTL